MPPPRTKPDNRRSRRRSGVPDKQSGAALLVFLALIVVAASYFLVSALNRVNMTIGRDQITQDALAQAKMALIGRAVADENRPGSLPCPDADGDGNADLLAGNDCPRYLGRLPWKTLKLGDLRDAGGERLWYALSPAFKDDDSAVINSDTLGTLAVYAADGSSLLTPSGYSAVAVVFAPGAPLSGQERNTVAAACATTGTTMERRLCAANYLDSGGTVTTRNNATLGGPFVAGMPSATFNDRLLFITTRGLMPVIEQRVARELITALNSFYTSYGFYPWADFNTFAYGHPSYEADANVGLNKGKLPLDLSYDATQETTWQGLLPAWFKDNRWYDMIFYAVGRNVTPTPGGCTSCDSSLLTVAGANNIHVAFIMPGPPAGTTTRPSTDWRAYLDDFENHHNDANGDSAEINDTFVAPASSAYDRDRLYYRDSSLNWFNR